MFNNTVRINNLIKLIVHSDSTENLVRSDIEKCMSKVQKLDKPVIIKIANGENLKAHIKIVY